MKTSNVLVPVAMAAMGANPAQANIGNAIRLAFDFFAGGIGDLLVEIFTKRDFEMSGIQARQGPPPGVPQFEYERCYEAMAGVTITATSPGEGSVQFSGVPAYCMNLANVLIGNGEGPYAQPCGSDCLLYQDLTPEQFDELVGALQANAS